MFQLFQRPTCPLLRDSSDFNFMKKNILTTANELEILNQKDLSSIHGGLVGDFTTNWAESDSNKKDVESTSNDSFKNDKSNLTGVYPVVRIDSILC